MVAVGFGERGRRGRVIDESVVEGTEEWMNDDDCGFSIWSRFSILHQDSVSALELAKSLRRL